MVQLHFDGDRGERATALTEGTSSHWRFDNGLLLRLRSLRLTVFVWGICDGRRQSQDRPCKVTLALPRLARSSRGGVSLLT